MENTDKRPVTDGTRSVPLRTIKDSVFRDLFSNPTYLLALYQGLHPEDLTVTESDLGNVTIRNVMMGRLYNDLAFTVRDRQLVMVEAQSTWTSNIAVRLLMYLADTWNAHIAATEQNPYSTRKLRLQKPEFYVVYTGEKEDRPEWLSLSEEFLDGDSFHLELKARVLYGTDAGNILDQYIMFSKIYSEQVRQKDRTADAVRETIRICKDQNILKAYLEAHEKEVVDIMLSCFDQEYLTSILLKEQRSEGREEGRELGRIEGLRQTALNMHRKGYTDAVIADILDIAVEQVREWIENNAVPA